MTEFPQCRNIRVDADELLTPSTSTPGFIKDELKTAAADFEKANIALLEQLRSSSWAAWSLLAAISALGGKTGKKMTIKPFNTLDPNFTFEQNAYAQPVDPGKATPKGKPILACSDNPKASIKAGQVLTDPQGRPYPGVGGGNDTEVRFNPLMWTPPPGGGAVAPGAEADEILLHEMTHGLRQMRGKMLCSGVYDHPSYDTIEEFIAILVSNMYRSERGRTGLRSDHGANSPPLSPALSDPATFLNTDANMDHIHKMFEEDPVFGKNLANVRCRFNPVKIFDDQYGKIFGRP